MKIGNWEKIKRWFRYWIVHRTFGGSVLLKDIPRIEIEKSDFIKIKRCLPRRPIKGNCKRMR